MTKTRGRLVWVGAVVVGTAWLVLRSLDAPHAPRPAIQPVVAPEVVDHRPPEQAPAVAVAPPVPFVRSRCLNTLQGTPAEDAAGVVAGLERVNGALGTHPDLLCAQAARMVRSGYTRTSEVLDLTAAMLDVAVRYQPKKRELGAMAFVTWAIEAPARAGHATEECVDGLNDLGLPDARVHLSLAQELKLEGPEVRRVELARRAVVLRKVEPVTFLTAVMKVVQRDINDGGRLGGAALRVVEAGL